MSPAIYYRAPFITFYSYKGGVGRSMAVLNVAALLASRGFRVLIIDFDLEAPGLTHLYGKGGKNRKSKTLNKIGPPGVVELLTDVKANGEDSFLLAKPFADIAADYSFELPIPAELKPHEDGRLLIMPAGCMDSSYAARFDDLDLADMYQQGVGQGLMLHFKKIISECGLFDYVIVDSRTGHSDEAGICTRDLATHLIIVSGFNRQNIAGTASFLRNLRAALGKDPSRRSPDIILSPVPIGEEDRLAEQEDSARNEFKEAWGQRLILDLSIPYHPRLALTEDAYVTTRTTSYLKTAYARIEDRLLSSLGHNPQSFYKKAAGAIKESKGQAAVAALRRALKLKRSIEGRPQNNGHSLWQYEFLPRGDDSIVGQILRLPEAEELFHLLTQASLPHELQYLGQVLHQRNAAEATIIDEALLRSSRRQLSELANYANFLHCLTRNASSTKARKGAKLDEPSNIDINIAKKLDTAEKFYKMALEVDPKNGNILTNYAKFLTEFRKDDIESEKLYKRALDIDSENFRYLSDYGQLLLGMGCIPKGLQQLREAWKLRVPEEAGNCAELAYCLWLGSCLNKLKSKTWERVFKSYLETGIERHSWSFNSILVRAKEELSPTTFKYTKALGDAFLDETQQLALEKFARWRKLVPLDPDLANPDGSERSA